MLSRQRFLQFLRLDEGRLPTVHFTLLMAMIASLFFSRAGLTASIILLLLITLTSAFLDKEVKLASVRWFVFPSMILILSLISIYFSADIVSGFAAIKVKALFLVLPFILLRSWMISERQLSFLYNFFLLCTLICSGWSLLQIPLRQLELSDMYARGEVIPTVIHHIRFSLMVAFGAVMSWLIAVRDQRFRILPHWAYIGISIFFAVFLHILAVRSGLAGFYAAVLVLVAVSFTNKKYLLWKVAGLVVGVLAVFLAYKYVPSLHSKVDYSIYSMQRYLEGHEDLGNYSDNRRLISYEAATDLIRKHPWTGVGIGDIKSEINAYYDIHYPKVDKAHLHPHNQYLFTAAASGIPTAAFLLLFNIMLLFHHVRKKNLLLISFNIILILSFLVEDTLEMQIGVIVYLLFNYLGWDSKTLKE